MRLYEASLVFQSFSNFFSNLKILLEYIVITVEQMVDSGVHLGHQVRRWNPKMAPYIYGERNGIHIIDILQTLICLKDTTNYLSKVGKESAVR